MNRTIPQWISLARKDPEAWCSALDTLLDDCVRKTDTSVISRKIPARPDSPGGPLAGIPYALKEAFDLKGFPTTASSRLPHYKNKSVTRDAAVVQRLRELGAVCVAKSQMNEFAYGLSGENPHFGDTPHPHLKDALSGGSSSGSAYLVAAGHLPLGVGTDTGGSIRLPAAWCGIYGVRWTPDYTCSGMLPLASTFDTIGWFTQTAEDMARSIRAWFDYGDESPPSCQGLRMASVPAYHHLEPETREMTRKILASLSIPELPDASTWESELPACRVAFNILQSHEAYLDHADTIEAHGSLMDPNVITRILRGREWSTRQLKDAAWQRDKMRNDFNSVFRHYDCLVLPVCPGPTRSKNESTPDLRERILDLTTPASLAGRPTLTLPIFLDARRSVGLQFIFKRPEPIIPLQILEWCAHLKKHAFTLWLLVAVLLAVIFPGPASEGGWLHADRLTKIGIWIIFFLQGLSLPTGELTSGYRPKRLHAFFLSWNFLCFPLITGLFLLPLSTFLSKDFQLGFWLLAILPTTVSSAVTFTAVTGGHSSKAIFATVLSNLLSVLIVPSIAAAYLAAGADLHVPLTPLFTKLALLIVVPLILGQVLRRVLPALSAAVAQKTKPVGGWIILFIVHAAFAKSVASGFLDRISSRDLAALLIGTILLLLLVGTLVWYSAAWLRITRRERVTAFFCASQKSLATGLPLATTIFAAAPGVVDSAAALIPSCATIPSNSSSPDSSAESGKPTSTRMINNPRPNRQFQVNRLTPMSKDARSRAFLSSLCAFKTPLLSKKGCPKGGTPAEAFSTAVALA